MYLLRRNVHFQGRREIPQVALAVLPSDSQWEDTRLSYSQWENIYGLRKEASRNNTHAVTAGRQTRGKGAMGQQEGAPAGRPLFFFLFRQFH